jgi:ankyrin repeat protein
VKGRVSVRTPGVAAFIALLFASGSPQLVHSADDAPLLAALRRHDVASVRTLLAAGTDPNVRDSSGATALMYAAAYSSPEAVRLLVDRGADPNLASSSGATALMWGGRDTAMVNALLGRGASHSARAADGTTPLLAAAHAGNVDAMKLLIVRGARTSAAPGDAAELLDVAYSLYGTEPMRTLLSTAGVPVQDPGRLTVPLVNNLRSGATLRQLLSLGANPNELVPFPTIQVPTVALAASLGLVDPMRSLIDSGADPDLKGSRALTPLMLAAAAPRPNPAVIRLLLERGANAQSTDDGGRTALDWALLQGETEAARLVRAAGAPGRAPGPVPAPVATPRTPGEAVRRALARLQPIGPPFYDRTKCISCHNQSLPAMAVRAAAARGIAADTKLATHPRDATLSLWRGSRDRFMLSRCTEPGFVPSTAYGLLALADEGAPSDLVTDAAALCLATKQLADGSWIIDDIRPPLGGSPIVFTAITARGLTAYFPPGRRSEMESRVGRARLFLTGTPAADTQDEAFKLLGLIWSTGPASQIAASAERLRTLQRDDGGWGQVPTMASDAYATGQALFALRAAGTLPTSSVYRAGMTFLLRTQLEDGSWFVRSRAIGFQPYFDYGFPHGADQFISAAATAWAAIALAHGS